MREERNDSGIISFDVNYTVSDYLNVVSEYWLIAKNRRLKKTFPDSPLKTKNPLYLRIMFLASAPLAHFNKSRKVGMCRFIIDKIGIRRTDKTEDKFVPWSTIIAAHRLSRAYLFETSNSSIPIPYRCLSNIQITRLDGIIETQVK